MMTPFPPTKAELFYSWHKAQHKGKPDLGFSDRMKFWENKGLGQRAASALAALQCENEADVRGVGLAGLFAVPNCGRKTIKEICQVLFNEDWFRQRINLPDKTLISELEARGYRVANYDQTPCGRKPDGPL